MKPVGVIVARFQTPFLHEGHRGLLAYVREQHHRVVVVLGVSPVLGGRKNPLDFHTRAIMIKQEFPDAIVLPLPDHPSDKQWSKSLDMLLCESFPGKAFLLYGSRDSFVPSYSGRFETRELPETTSDSATLIRDQVSEQVLQSSEFRSGIIYAYANTYPKVYPTVDIAVFRHDRQEILLGQKSIDQRWRLPGGFADPSDECFEEAAKRELAEECSNMSTGPMHYERSFRLNDWRYRVEQDKIITLLFSTDFISGSPVAGDDLAEVRWFSLEQLTELIDRNEIVNEHIPHFEFLLGKHA